MFIEIIIEGKEPTLIDITKAGKMAQKLEKAGAKFRLGKTC